MPEQYLHGPKVARCLVDDGRLRPPHGMRAIILTRQANPRHPLIHEARILSRAHVVSVIGPAREHEIVDTPAPQFEPFQQARPGVIHDLKLYRAPRFLLNDDCAVTDIVIADDVADRDFHKVAAT